VVEQQAVALGKEHQLWDRVTVHERERASDIHREGIDRIEGEPWFVPGRIAGRDPLDLGPLEFVPAGDLPLSARQPHPMERYIRTATFDHAPACPSGRGQCAPVIADRGRTGDAIEDDGLPQGQLALGKGGEEFIADCAQRHRKCVGCPYPAAHQCGFEPVLITIGTLFYHMFQYNGGYGSILLSLSKGVLVLSASVREGKNNINAHGYSFGVGIDLRIEQPKPAAIARSAARLLSEPRWKQLMARLRTEFEAYRPHEIIAAYLAYGVRKLPDALVLCAPHC
jgi:hypothetical protein